MGSKLPNDVKHPKSKIPPLYARDDDGTYRTLSQHEFKVWKERLEGFLVSQGLHDFHDLLLDRVLVQISNEDAIALLYDQPSGAALDWSTKEKRTDFIKALGAISIFAETWGLPEPPNSPSPATVKK